MKVDVCTSCGAFIVWAKTQSGKATPFDAAPVDVIAKWTIEDGIAIYRGADFTGTGYVPHWATCPTANAHRKGKGS